MDRGALRGSERAHHPRLVELQAHEIAVVARADDAVAAGAEPLLGGADAAELLGDDGQPVGDARREAGARRLRGEIGEALVAEQRAHVVLGEARVAERREDGALARGALPGTEVARVVGDLAVGDGLETALGADRLQHVEELGLAVVAARGVVHRVERVLDLLRRDEPVLDAERLGAGARVAPIALGVRRRIGRHGEDALAPQRAHGGDQQRRGVDAAGEGDEEARAAAEIVVEGPAAGGGGRRHGEANVGAPSLRRKHAREWTAAPRAPMPIEPASPDEIPDRTDVLVLGSGPAGLFAAIEAAGADAGLSVVVCERRPFAGGQVPVAGGGRCNVTNAGSVADLMAGFGRDGRWLEPALRHLDNVETIRWFEARGVPMKEEEGGKMFPCSDDGADVQNALIREAEGLGAKILLRTRIESVEIEEGRVRAAMVSGKRVACGALVLAGGGGGPKPTPTSGVGLAGALGHALVPPAPALAPIKLAGKPVELLSGISLVARLSAGAPGFVPKKAKVAKTGDLLFTHIGLSGPVVLDLSHPLARLAARGPAELSIDLLPDLPPEKGDLRAEIDRLARTEGARAAKKMLFPALPRRVVEFLLARAAIDGEKRCGDLRAEERDAAARLAHDLRFTEWEVTWAGAMVTGGGVALTEVDPKTLASRRVAGLYLAGEVLDLQGDCGGYNLQASFSTGSLAGASAAASVVSAQGA